MAAKNKKKKVQSNGSRKLDAPIVAPSILSADLGNLAAELDSVEAAGADWIHIDVMDGSFVPPITWGANVVEVVSSRSKLFVDTHLMIVNPERHLAAFAAAGTDTLTVHQETCPHLNRTLNQIRELGLLAGVSINPGTPVASIFDVLELCDLVLIMTVNPGWGGQRFIQSTLKKISALRAEIERRNLSAKIEVDGGINAETAKLCVAAGAHILVAGSYVFGDRKRARAISSLRR